MNTKSVRIILVGLMALCLSLAFTGCATGGPVADSGLIQTVLDQVVPANFEGDLNVHHTGHYAGTTISFDIDIKGLKKVNDHWTWVSGGYTRSGIFSNGGLTLTPTVK